MDRKEELGGVGRRSRKGEWVSGYDVVELLLERRVLLLVDEVGEELSPLRARSNLEDEHATRALRHERAALTTGTGGACPTRKDERGIGGDHRILKQ